MDRFVSKAVGYHVEQRSPDQQRWLEANLEEGELLIAWLGATKPSPPAGIQIPPGKVIWRFVLSTERAFLVAFSKRGSKGEPPASYELPVEEELVTKSAFGADEVRLGGWSWKTTLTNEGSYEDVASFSSLPAEERRREVARQNWVSRHAAFSQALLERSTSPEDRLSRAYITMNIQTGEDIEDGRLAWEAALADFLLEEGGVALARWARMWQLTPGEQIDLVRSLLEAEDERIVAGALLPHRQARAALLPHEKDLEQRSLLDLAFGRHLIRAGEHTEAATVLEERLLHLPDEVLVDLLPPKDMDLTKQGTQGLRIRLLDLLVEARGEQKMADLEAVAELARLQPLLPARVGALAEAAGGGLRERARTLAELLGPEGFSSRPHSPPKRVEVHPVPADELSALSHPAAQRGGSFDWLQTRLGKVNAPDHSTLRSYAERVTDKSHPALMEALSDAAMVLGVPGVEGYISRGEQGFGLRAYEGSPPFVLVGVQHLEEDSDAFLHSRVLLFAVAAEVAHLRFKHTRLTSSDVWDGAFQKGATVLETVAVFAGPLGILGGALARLQRLARIERVLRGAEWVTAKVGKAAELAGYAKGVKRVGMGQSVAPVDTEIGNRESELLAACRLLQLTADRAGLVVCGDLVAATEGIFLCSGEHRAELPMARRHGLVKTLGRRDESGALLNQNLALRLAALYSFYLSFDYEELRKAVVGDEL